VNTGKTPGVVTTRRLSDLFTGVNDDDLNTGLGHMLHLDPLVDGLTMSLSAPSTTDIAVPGHWIVLPGRSAKFLVARPSWKAMDPALSCRAQSFLLAVFSLTVIASID
jgi:hypothetical protein